MARASRVEWRSRVAGWLASGESCAAYARRIGVNPATLSWWKWKLGGEGAAEEAVDAGAFVEITGMVGHEERITLGVGEIDVRIPDGFDEDTLGRVLAVLEGRR